MPMLATLPELTWPERIFGPRPTGKEIRFACLCSLACAIVILTVFLVGGRGRVAAVGYREDFVAFYGIGQLLNEHPADRLYDFPTQEKIYLELRPDETFLGLPYVHAPFEALVFQPFALLPYEMGYLAWLVVSMAVYTAGLWILTSRFGPQHGPDRTTTFLLAQSFSPFMMESWLGGNVTVIPFVGLALALTLEDAEHPVLGGCALALCLNKPSLLVLILPMLLLSRRFKMLAGFAAGAAALVVASSLILGIDAWADFVKAMIHWAQMTSSQPGLFRDWKYVDINAFSRVLPGGRSWLAVSVTAAAACAALLVLLRMWLVLPRAGRAARNLAWAAAITGTLVLNVYVPIYDCTLLVPAGIVAAAALRDPISGSLPPAFEAVVALCYLTAWVTQPLAQTFRLQLYTLVLIYMGLFLVRQFHRVWALAAVPGAVEAP